MLASNHIYARTQTRRSINDGFCGLTKTVPTISKDPTVHDGTCRAEPRTVVSLLETAQVEFVACLLAGVFLKWFEGL